MRKNYIIVSGLLIAGAFVMMSSSTGRSDDRTGAPSASGNCGSCHSGGTQGTSITLAVTEKGTFNAVTSYKPGKTYTIAISVLGLSTAKGFQSTVLDADNKKIGTVANPATGSRVISTNNRDIVVQTTPSLSGMWTYEWTAPANPTGRVTIYTAGLAANSDGTTNGDQSAVNSTTLTLDASSSAASPNIVSLTAYPNPCSDVLQLNKTVDEITVTGINGAVYPVEFTGMTLNTRALPQGDIILSARSWRRSTERSRRSYV